MRRLMMKTEMMKGHYEEFDEDPNVKESNG